jgi:predicted enzyme related to lactoylglutathione lyase
LHPRLQIGIDSQDPEHLAPFWATALGYTVGDFDRDRTYLDLVPPDLSSPVVYFQHVPEHKRVKNRVHLDLYVVNPGAVIDGIVELGATRLGVPQSGSEGGWWQVMADPEGNEFCICREN